MPNGRSGGFLVGRKEFAALLVGMPATSAVGPSVASAHRARSLGEPAVCLSAADTIALLATFGSDSVWIEEQDHKVYLIHLDRPVDAAGMPDAEKWIIAGPESSLFMVLRQMHEDHRRPPTSRQA
jgi:hypothetical protein